MKRKISWFRLISIAATLAVLQIGFNNCSGNFRAAQYGMAEKDSSSTEEEASSIPAPNPAPLPMPTGYPNASNTGPAAGTVFQSFPVDEYGNYVVKTDGAVLNGFRGKGSIIVEARNVTIQNCDLDVTGKLYGISSTEGLGTKVLNCNIYSTGLGGHVASHVLVMVGGADEVAFNNIWGADNAVSCGSCHMHDNFIHDFTSYAGEDYHSDGLQTYGSAGAGGLRVIHNTIIAIATQGTASPTNWAGTSSVLALSEGMHDLVVDNNLFAGGSYTMYGPSQAGSSPLNVRITNNRFSQQYYPKVGAFGITAGFNPSAPGYVWSGNVYHETGLPAN